MELLSYISDVLPGQGFYTFTPYEDTYLLDKRKITECAVSLDDGRRITARQRRYIYAIFNDISQYNGDVPEAVKSTMKCGFIASTGHKEFSLSDTDMTTANEFLEYLIEFCIEWNIPTKDSLLNYSPDISRYIYCCLVHKTCCVTGAKARVQLHHVDAVGMGRNRKDIIHKGMRVMPLRWDLHSEAHTIGQKEFDKKYKVYGIKLDDDLCRIWKVKSK